jgi:predicted esterase
VNSPLAPDKPVRTFEQRHIEVSRSARYAIMGSFDGPLSEVWIVCHGQGQLATRFLSRFLPLERDDRLFIAPEALSRYYVTPPKSGPNPANAPIGASWMTREDRECEIEDYVRYLDSLHDEIFSHVNRNKVQLWVLGFSQGTATAARWVVRGKVEPDRVVLWSGMVPPELTAASAASLARRTPLTIVFGRNDEFASPELIAAQEVRVKELGVPHQTIRFDGGHEIVPDALRMLVESGPAGS